METGVKFGVRFCCSSLSGTSVWRPQSRYTVSRIECRIKFPQNQRCRAKIALHPPKSRCRTFLRTALSHFLSFDAGRGPRGGGGLVEGSAVCKRIALQGGVTATVTPVALLCATFAVPLSSGSEAPKGPEFSRHFSPDALQLQMPNLMAFFTLQTFVLDISPPPPPTAQLKCFRRVSRKQAEYCFESAVSKEITHQVQVLSWGALQKHSVKTYRCILNCYPINSRPAFWGFLKGGICRGGNLRFLWLSLSECHVHCWVYP